MARNVAQKLIAEHVVDGHRKLVGRQPVRPGDEVGQGPVPGIARAHAAGSNADAFRLTARSSNAPFERYSI